MTVQQQISMMIASRHPTTTVTVHAYATVFFVCAKPSQPISTNDTESSNDDGTAVVPGNGDRNDDDNDDNPNAIDRFHSPTNPSKQSATLLTAPPRPQKLSAQRRTEIPPCITEILRLHDRLHCHRLSYALAKFSLDYLRATPDEHRQLPGLNDFHLSRTFNGLIANLCE